MPDLDAYFVRIGYDGPREPTLPVLRELQARHPATITFEAIDCLLDRGVDLDPAAVEAKLLHAKRGGYCFEQNGLFFRVLQALGFQVSPLAGRVVWGLPPGAPTSARTHRVTRVELEGESWIVDVGFGSAVQPAPLKIVPNLVQETIHDTYRLAPMPGGVVMELLRDGVWLPAWQMPLEPAAEIDFEVGNWWTSTHPTSHFRKNLLAARTAPEARYALLHNRLAIRPVGGAPTKEVLDADGIERALRDIFHLPVQPDWRPLIERAAAYTGE